MPRPTLGRRKQTGQANAELLCPTIRSAEEVQSDFVLSQRDRLIAAAFGGFCHGLGPCARAQFPEQGFDVEFHGVQRDVQSARNGLVGHAFRKRRKHFQFARR